MVLMVWRWLTVLAEVAESVNAGTLEYVWGSPYYSPCSYQWQPCKRKPAMRSRQLTASSCCAFGISLRVKAKSMGSHLLTEHGTGPGAWPFLPNVRFCYC